MMCHDGSCDASSLAGFLWLQKKAQWGCFPMDLATIYNSTIYLAVHPLCVAIGTLSFYFLGFGHLAVCAGRCGGGLRAVRRS